MKPERFTHCSVCGGALKVKEEQYRSILVFKGEPLWAHVPIEVTLCMGCYEKIKIGSERSSIGNYTLVVDKYLKYAEVYLYSKAPELVAHEKLELKDLTPDRLQAFLTKADPLLALVR